MLFKFKQRAHQFIKHPPSDEDLASWLGMMQHHGVPTRLLDWTTSPYVALYFALEEAPQTRAQRSTIWAINLAWLREKATELSGQLSISRREDINRLLERWDTPLVIEVDPPRGDHRMAAQQGFFLCKLFGQATFNQILMAMMMHPQSAERPVVRRIEVPSNLRIDMLKRLRSMNISRASLFPDLDGFCQSLKIDLDIRVREQGQEPGVSIAEMEKLARGIS